MSESHEAEDFYEACQVMTDQGLEIARLRAQLKDRERRLGVIRQLLTERFSGPRSNIAGWLNKVYCASDLRRPLSKPQRKK